jgi:hypothetical protein
MISSPCLRIARPADPFEPSANRGNGELGRRFPGRAQAFGQLYRDRGDEENVFDEMKNQWGWGGYTTHDLVWRDNLDENGASIRMRRSSRI